MTSLSFALALVALLAFVALLYFFTSRVRAGQRPMLRKIAGYDLLKGFSGKAIESGRPFHLSLGLGSVSDASTADSLAGLHLLDHLAEQTAVTRVSPTVTMANPMVMLLAQNRLRTAYKQNPMGAQEAYRSVRWLAPQPAAYAAGVMSLFSVDRVAANVMVGTFGDEYLLMGEAALRHDIAHVGGASNPNTLPFIYASAQETLLGEEIYAAGAYLQKHPSHIGSLLAQDTMRWLVAAVMLGGVLLATLGVG
ncbi:MAG: hypothetical protein Kow0031_34220 [Anaerolineae bacterium]